MMLMDTVLSGVGAETSGLDLVAAMQGARGIVGGTITRGQLALAEWIVRHEGRALLSVGETALVRLLTGELDPGDLVAQHIAMLTDGAVLPEMFAEPAVLPAPAPETPAAADPVVAAGGAVDQAPGRPPASPPVPAITAFRTGDTVTIGDDRIIWELSRTEARVLHGRLAVALVD